MARVYNSGEREWFNYAHADIGNQFVIEGLQELTQKLERLLMSNPYMERKVRKVINKFLQQVRKTVSANIRQEIDKDPRGAYKAVRKLVYKQLLGGNINILNNRRAGSPSKYKPTRTLKGGQRGGNRRLRTERTMRMESYGGKDRGFVLRFLEGGTGARTMGKFHIDPHRRDVKRGSQGGTRYGNLSMVNTGNRGRIDAKNFFGRITSSAFGDMEGLVSAIDELIAQEFGE